MYGREQRVLLRHYLERGLSKAEIARELGVARRTVYHWIGTGQLDRELDDAPVRYAARPPVARKVDPFRDIIEARLTEFPKLSAIRLFEEIRAAGYDGGYTQVKDCVRQVRPTPAADPVVRFETPPGHQGQVDFAEFRLPWGKRYALVVVLGYSRLLWLQFYARQTMVVLMRGLEDAFAYFGGVPAELLFDQLKAVIVDDEREIGGRLLENAEFMRFAAHWDFRVRACRPYRAKTKGKVERPIGYVRQGFFYGRQLPQRCRPQRPGAVVADADGQRPHPSDHRRAAAPALRTRRARPAAALGGAPVSIVGHDGEQARAAPAAPTVRPAERRAPPARLV